MATYLDDLAAGGYIGLPFAWDADGNCMYSEQIPQLDRDAIEAIFAAHAAEKPFVATVTDPTRYFQGIVWAPDSPMLVAPPARPR